jgi:hypothetical protein
MMNPNDLLGSHVMKGKCSDKAIYVPVNSELVVFAIFKNGSHS